jgi:hypothetical protein
MVEKVLQASLLARGGALETLAGRLPRSAAARYD